MAACCFSGHSELPIRKIRNIIINLEREIDSLIAKGVTNFISGGNIGFDLIAASLIIAKKEMGGKIRLIFALPYKEQDALWEKKQKNLYQSLLKEADDIIYVSDKDDAYCIKRQYDYMVEQSDYCVCALIHNKSATSRFVAYAYKNGLKIVNVAE